MNTKIFGFTYDDLRIHIGILCQQIPDHRKCLIMLISNGHEDFIVRVFLSESGFEILV